MGQTKVLNVDYDSDNYESREVEHMCTKCGLTESRSGLDMCLLCYVANQHRVIEQEHEYMAARFRQNGYPIAKILNKELSEINVEHMFRKIEPFDFGIERLGDEVHLIAYYR
jgi:hypothetical protein